VEKTFGHEVFNDYLIRKEINYDNDMMNYLSRNCCALSLR